MAKAQVKKAAAGKKSAAKKVAVRVKSAAGAAKKKVAPKKPAPKPAHAKPAKPAARAVKKAAVKKVAQKVHPKPAKTAKPAQPAAKPVAKVTVAARAVKSAAKGAVAKAAGPVKAAAAKAKAVVAAAAPPIRAALATARPAAPAAEKKRGRRARPRVQSTGAPAANWLSTEKPRPASFIPAPPRAEAPSAIAAPPASSDRLIRPDDVDHPAVRTVPVRIDVEQGAGRFYVIASPSEITLRPGEGIEWDFRYLGGADVTVEEIVVELERPSPFGHTVFRTRKPGGARPHRQMSGGASTAAVGKRIGYTVRAMTQFKAEVASTRGWVNVTA